MTFKVPTLQESIERRTSDLALRAGKEEFPVNDQVVLARVIAGSENGLYGHQSYIARQIVPDQSEDEFLVRYARWWGVFRKDPAQAVGRVHLTGNVGMPVAAKTLLQRSDGAQFSITENATLADGGVSVAVKAETAGIEGNTAVGFKLSFVSAVPGVRGEAVVEVAINGGADIESIDALRGRLQTRVRQPPMGGAPHDYERWTLEVPGVTRAWPYPRRMGLGTVSVTFVMDDIEDGPIPPPEKVNEVIAYLEDRTRKVACCELFIFAPIPDPIVFKIHGLRPDTPAVRAAIETELRDLLRREAEPGGFLPISHVREAISRAQGEIDHRLIFPDDDLTPDFGHLPVFGSIDWGKS